MSSSSITGPGLPVAALLFVAGAMLLIISCLFLWMTYGRLRCLTLPRVIEEARRHGILVAILAGVGALMFAILCFALIKARMPGVGRPLIIGAAVMTFLFLGISLAAVLLAVWVRDRKKKARTSALVGATLTAGGLVFAFSGLALAGVRASYAHIADDNVRL